MATLVCYNLFCFPSGLIELLSAALGAAFIFWSFLFSWRHSSFIAVCAHGCLLCCFGVSDSVDYTQSQKLFWGPDHDYVATLRFGVIGDCAIPAVVRGSMVVVAFAHALSCLRNLHEPRG